MVRHMGDRNMVEEKEPQEEGQVAPSPMGKDGPQGKEEGQHESHTLSE